MSPTLLSDFDFTVPPELIAEEPVEPRDASRLMVLQRKTGGLSHHLFRDIQNFLNPGDLLVVNNTRVIPARIIGKKETGGRIELLLLREMGEGIWESLIFPGKRVKIGTPIHLDNGKVILEVRSRSDEGIFELQIVQGGPLDLGILEALGRVPLPPYISASRKKSPALETRYQTVYSKNHGATAAPTAGLHFTQELLAGLRGNGVRIAEVTLHTGFGTFRPVRAEIAEEHKMHAEWCSVSAEVVEEIRAAKRRGGRVVAVGTTVVRALESAARRTGVAANRGADGEIQPFQGDTSLFILPGYPFRVVDALITNFHWPRTTLILMVSAFAGKDLVLTAYREAITQKYRFFSFGDAMLIL